MDRLIRSNKSGERAKAPARLDRDKLRSDKRTQPMSLKDFGIHVKLKTNWMIFALKISTLIEIVRNPT